MAETALQKPSNPLKDPELPRRFGDLIIRYMVILKLSDEELLTELRNVGVTKGSLASIKRHKDGLGGQPSAKTIGLYQEALKIADAEIQALLYPGARGAIGQPSNREFRDQFQELVAELQRQSNLPYEIQSERAKAKVALAEEDFEKARRHLNAAADATRRTAEHAAEEYARSLAALGALAFTETDYVSARKHYGAAMKMSGVADDRVRRYRRSYLVASNAIMANSPTRAAAHKIFGEMVDAGLKPDEVTYNTLINLADDYKEGRKLLKQMVDAGLTPNELTLITLVRLAPNFETGCDLAREAKNGRDWRTGSGFYAALFSLQITHLDAKHLLEAYNSLPLRFDKALENPIKQYRHARRHDEAMKLCLFAPHLPAAQKLYKDRYEICRAYLQNQSEPLQGNSNYHYCFGIAARINNDWPLARKHLNIALDLAYAQPRIQYIKELLEAIPDAAFVGENVKPS
jgi:tetratricopeptide (TPR) repeat protein